MVEAKDSEVGEWGEREKGAGEVEVVEDEPGDAALVVLGGARDAKPSAVVGGGVPGEAIGWVGGGFEGQEGGHVGVGGSSSMVERDEGDEEEEHWCGGRS